ncbi:hypothetical protein ABW19_dt0205615 [Dactylella cylindrospora]|nr:hypothetical protein ABW19_dt0205615 [Dactylella cylindrospora]
MASLTTSVENFFSAIIGIFQNLLNSVFAVFTSILALFQTAISSVFELGKSFIGFLFSNIVILSVMAVAFVVYTAIMQRNAGGAGPGLVVGKNKA